MKHGLKRSLKFVFWGGVSTSFVDTLVVGPTLLAYAALLGAGDITFGFLGAIPYFGNLAHLLSAWLIEHNYSIRKTAFRTAFISRYFLLIAALLAFYPHMPGALFILISALTLKYFIGCISGGVWLPWMKSLIPEKIMGRFFAYRFKYMMITKIICFWGTALLFKYSDLFVSNEIYIYSILFLIAFFVGLFSAWTLSQVDDKKQNISSSLSFKQKIVKSFQNNSFRKLLYTLCFINFSIAFVTPFITIFMLKYLDIPMSTILIFTLIMQLSYTFVVKRLGILADKLGTWKVIQVSIPLLVFSLIPFLFLNQINTVEIVKYLLLGLGHIFLGIATAGITLGINNASLIFVPKKSAAIYLSVNSVLKSFAGGLGSIVAGFILSFCTFTEKLLSNHFSIFYLNRWVFFFTFSILLSIMAYLTITRWKEYLMNKKID